MSDTEFVLLPQEIMRELVLQRRELVLQSALNFLRGEHQIHYPKTEARHVDRGDEFVLLPPREYALLSPVQQRKLRVYRGEYIDRFPPCCPGNIHIASNCFPNSLPITILE